jgi:hypothetical protein
MRMWIVLLLGACGGTASAPATSDLAPATKPPIVDLAPSHAAITGLAIGARHTCALHADGTVSCWGANATGQLGVPGDYDRTRPIRVPGISDAVEVRPTATSRACAAAARRSRAGATAATPAMTARRSPSGRCTPDPAVRPVRVTSERTVECMGRNSRVVKQVQGFSGVLR